MMIESFLESSWPSAAGEIFLEVVASQLPWNSKGKARRAANII